MPKKATILPELFESSVSLKEGECGVYGIVNNINGKIYIGATTNLPARKKIHAYKIRTKDKTVHAIWPDVWKNPQAFEFVLIENTHDLLGREQFWCDFYKSYLPECGYNLRRNSASMRGYVHSDETRRLVSISSKQKRRPWAAIHREALSKAKTGVPNLLLRKPVLAINDQGVEVYRFDSAESAVKEIGGSKSAIVMAIWRNGKSQGLTWKYA